MSSELATVPCLLRAFLPVLVSMAEELLVTNSKNSMSVTLLKKILKHQVPGQTLEKLKSLTQQFSERLLVCIAFFFFPSITCAGTLSSTNFPLRCLLDAAFSPSCRSSFTFLRVIMQHAICSSSTEHLSSWLTSSIYCQFIC